MLATLTMLGIVGWGVGTMVVDFVKNDSHSLQGKLQLIYKRCDIATENKESHDSKKKKLYPSLTKIGWNGNNKVLYYKLPTGLSFRDVLQKMNYITDGLGAEVIPKQLEGDYKSDFTFTVLSGHLQERVDYTNESELLKSKQGMFVPIGWSRRGFEQLDLSQPDTCDLLIAGVKGSGKSTLMRLIGTSLILNYSDTELNLWLADFKNGAEFSVFGNTSLVKNKITHPHEAKKFFIFLLEACEQRNILFTQNNCVDIDEFNIKYPKNKIPHIIMMLDELAMLQGKNEEHLILTQLGAVARSSGIHLIISTQRPDRNVIDSNLKNNIAVTVGFRTKNQVSSRVVLGEQNDRLAYIDPDLRGRCIMQHGAKEIYVQVPLITPSKASELLIPYQIPLQQSNNSSQITYSKST